VCFASLFLKQNRIKIQQKPNVNKFYFFLILFDNMETNTLTRKSLVKKMSLHAVGVCASLPLIGLGACAKKQVRQEVKTLPAVHLTEAGYLQFGRMQDFDSVLKHYPQVHLPDGFAKKPLTKSGQGDWERLKALFSADSLLAVGEDLYRIEAGKIYKSNLNQTDTWIQVRELVNVSEINATYYLPKCPDAAAYTPVSAQKTLLAKDIADIETFIAEHGEWFGELEDVLQANHASLLQLQAHGTAQEKEAAQIALNILEARQNIQKAKAWEGRIAQHSNKISYFNSLYELQKQTTFVRQGKSAVAIIGAIASGLIGLTNTIMDGLKPDPTQVAVQGMVDLAQILSDNYLASLNSILSH